MINLKIDGKDVQIARGATILDAAESVGVKIPTLCYLKKVSPVTAGPFGSPPRCAGGWPSR